MSAKVVAVQSFDVPIWYYSMLLSLTVDLGCACAETTTSYNTAIWMLTHDQSGRTYGLFTIIVHCAWLGGNWRNTKIGKYQNTSQKKTNYVTLSF